MNTNELPPSHSDRFFPYGWWIVLLKAAGAAHDFRKLFIGVAGLALLILLNNQLPALAPTYNGVQQPLVPGLPDVRGGPFLAWQQAFQPTSELWLLPITAFADLFKGSQDFKGWLFALIKALATGVVTVLMGAAISRVAAHDLCRRPRISLLKAVRFSFLYAYDLVISPLVPTIGLVLLGLLCAFFGLFFRLPAPYGSWIGGVLAIIPFVLAIPMALLVLGLTLGWPLMVVSVSTESQDVFDALSRSFSYVFKRLPQYLVLLGTAWFMGTVGWLLFVTVERLVMGLGIWGMSLGGPGELIHQILAGALPPVESEPVALNATYASWAGLVRLLAYSWVLSYFWCAATAIYLVLRRDLDGTAYTTLDGDLYGAQRPAVESSGIPGAMSVEASVPEPVVPPSDATVPQAE